MLQIGTGLKGGVERNEIMLGGDLDENGSLFGVCMAKREPDCPLAVNLIRAVSERDGG